MFAATDNKGVFARSETGHSATPAHGPSAVPPQPSGAGLPAAFRRALASGARNGDVAPPQPKAAKAPSGEATGMKPDAPRRNAPRNVTIGPRSGHK